MTSQTKMLSDLIEKVSIDLGDVTSTERLFAQENAFAALVRSAPRRRRQRRLIAVSIAAIAVVCFMSWLMVFFTVDEIPFYVGNTQQRGVIGRWEATPKGADSVIAFAQGSRINLREQTVARVTTADERKVRVTLRSGFIEPDIVGNGKTEWIVEAGPWRISVLGTHFTVHWQREKDFLEVAVTHGKVRVQRDDGMGAASEVSGGELFRAVNDRRTVVPIESINAVSALPEGPSPGQNDVAPAHETAQNDSPPKLEEPRKAGETRVSVAKNDDGARLEWLVQYANGAYDAAVTSAAKYGIEQLIEQLDAVRLWKLQDAARVTKRYDLSAKILRRFRERFPKDKNAHVAGFLLGRVAMDKRQYAVASRWFNTYIAEAPHGPLAEEAHGLLIIVYEKTGRPDRAKQAAKAYLNRYQGGAFAKIADAHVRDR